MTVRALGNAHLALLLIALPTPGCDQPTSPAADAEPSEAARVALGLGQGPSTIRMSDFGRDIFARYKEELWPCPHGYAPLQIHEYVASAPPPKLPGNPEYWEACPAAPGFATNHNSSVGIATHLGTITNEWDACLDFNTLTGFFDAQLTAADGTKLNWEITATATPLPGGGLHSVTTDITFDGGTGRFADAKGYAAGEGRGVPGEGENLYYVGCLAY